MKRKYTLALAALTLCGSLSAQDIYKIESLTSSDLNGTARFVGMGGAMNALGADLSTIGSNPAAIGMYRRSDAAFTGSATIQPDGQQMGDIDKARGSFDQAGFVYSVNMGRHSKVKFVNFAFNYQKRRNFKNYIGLDNIGVTNGMSQSWQMQDLAYYEGKVLDLSSNDQSKYTTPLAFVGYDAQMIAPTYDNDGKLVAYEPSKAQGYNYHRVQWGGIQQYDFNMSFNVKNRFYGGVTFGVYNVNMHNALQYDELLYQNNAGVQEPIGWYNMDLAEEITGTGFDAKFGFIFRPIETSPFRIGLSFSTPIFYDLTQSGYLRMESPYQITDNNGSTYDRTQADYKYTDLDYRVRTPWKLNICAATTVGNYLAVDAEYEVSRYTGAQLRWPDYNRGGYWDWDRDYVRSTRDTEMDKEIDACFNTVQTFRIGAEIRLAPGVFGRLGYNYVSSPFKKDAYLNTFTSSPSYNYTLNSDYVNLGATNRVTAGLGYRGKHFYADLAYQYQTQSADVYAFRTSTASQYDPSSTYANSLPAQKIDLKRHNVMLTLGCKF